MTDRLAERLKELAAFLEHQHAVESVEETVGHLQTEIQDTMARSRASAQQCTILLFQSDDPPSLLRFLDASADFSESSRKREVSHARISVLGLLADFLEAYGDHRALTKQHVVALYQTCQGIARADPFNKVKAQALAVVINVLKVGCTQVTNEEIGPREYVDKLFYDVKFSKATQTAKGQMLEVIGYLAQKFPADVTDSVLPLLDWIEDALEKQFASNSPEMLLVNGLLFALARLLECDPERYKRDESMRKKVYSYLFTVFATTVSGNLSRYQVTKSAEIFLAQHASMFQHEIGPSGHVWFSYMKFCCSSRTKTVKEHAYKCSSATFKSLNAYFLSEKDDTRKKCLNRILKEVLPVVSDVSADTDVVSFALQCLGCLAGSISIYLGAKSFSKIEAKLKLFGENLLAMDAKSAASRWSLFSQFLQCIENFVREDPSDSLDDGYINFLGDLLCHLMTVYPHCLWKSKLVVYKSVVLLFDALSKRAVVEPLIGRFIHHTLLLSISNVTGPDQEIIIYHPETGELETKLLYDFEEFWLALLCRANYIAELAQNTRRKTQNGSDDVDMEEPVDGERTLQAVLFDSVVKHVLCILGQLNLSYKYDLQTTNNGNNASGYTPIVPRDHSIMLNLTEFVERVLGKLQMPLLIPWIAQLLQKVFILATRMPLVSSFYRIGTVLAKAIDELAYFDEKYANVVQSRLRGDFEYFVTKVCAQARFYQDELLVACAAFVLASPVRHANVHYFSGIFKSTLALGRSYLPAANIAVTALERWQRQCPEELDGILSDVVPLLSAFFDQDDIEYEGSNAVKSITKRSSYTHSQGASDFVSLQRRILLLLGRCGGKMSLLMSEPPSISTGNGRIGDISSPFFQLKLDLSGMPLSVPMGTMLAHLGELATQSTVRRVKASASEGYHALICYLCGMTTTHPHASGKKTVFYDLWREVFTRIVGLATDTEKICRSLFEPLLFQLLHWFGTNSDSFPFEYTSMLDEMMKRLSDTESTAVRAVSARCIAALLTLTLETQMSHVKADDIFERVFSLCRHAGAVQRNGAAAAISYFLRSLHEEDGALIIKFAMPCVKNLLSALRMCDSDIRHGIGGEDISRDVISRAVMKIERGVGRFPQLFLHKGKGTGQKSRVEDDAVLPQITIWLFKQTSKREALFRRLCRRLFVSFSTLINGSCSQWLEGYASLYGRNSISAIIVPMSLLVRTLPLRAEDMVNWMDQLSASIEAFCWCFELLGDKFEGVFGQGEMDARQESAKRKFTEDVSEATKCSFHQTLSWAVAVFLKQKDPWNDQDVLEMPPSMRTQWVGSYLLALVSLCSGVKSSMENSSGMLRGIANVHDQSFLAAVADKVLLTSLHRHNSWSNDADAFNELDQFCKYLVAHSPEWTDQLKQSSEALLRPLETCVAEINTEELYVKYASNIRVLCVFGSKVLNAGIISSTEASTHANIFALTASKAIKYGGGLPDNYFIAVTALQAASACGWGIIDVLVNDTSRRVYAPVYNDIVHFIPTLEVWKQCASQLVSLSLMNSHMLSILVDALRQVVGFKVYAAGSAEWNAFVETLVASIKVFVDSLETASDDTQRTLSLLQVLHLFLQLSAHCSRNLMEALRIGPIHDIRDAVIGMLKKRGCSYLVKTEILRMLPVMGSSSILIPDEVSDSKPVLEALVAFVFDEFPIVSTDVSRGSKDFDVFRVLFVELLGLIERSKSISYLRIIYPSLKEENAHLFATDINNMLSRFSIALASEGKTNASTVCSNLAELFETLLDSSLDVATRKTLLENVFTPVIEFQTTATLQHFYLMESPTKKSTILGVLASLISTSAEANSVSGRFAASVAYALVEILYRLMDPDLVRGDINAAFLGHKNGKGREFTMLVCKCASKVITRTYEHLDEVTRVSCCAAYSCLLTAVSRTQKQEKFFDQILFQPALWTNIVDTVRQYELGAETKQFATVPLSSLSMSSLQSRVDKEVAEGRPRQNASSALQFFTASSLSMDADAMASSVMTVPTETLDMKISNQDITIELDDFNQHPCMIPLLRVLVQMKTNFGSNWNETAMPGWMKKIFDVMVDSSTDLNVQMFLSKVVMNVFNVFTMYASSWLRTVMETLLDGTNLQSEPEFNYLLRDCCHLILGAWKDVSALSLKGTASRFVNKLIELCPHRINQIRDNNVLLVTRLITLWKDNAIIDVSYLSSYIHNEDEDARLQAAKQFTALQMVSVMLSEGLTSGLRSEVGEPTIEDGILLVMRNKRSSLYLVAAEVGGLYLKSVEHTENGGFKKKLSDLIVSSYNDEEFGRFLALLRNASMHQPEIIDGMMLHRLSFVLPKVVSIDAWSVMAADALGSATANTEIVGEVFMHVQSVLGRFIAHRHSSVQYSILQAVSRLVDHLTRQDIERLIRDVSDGGLGLLEYYESHDLAACRELLFGITKKLHERDLAPTTKQRIKCSLLHAMCDPDEELRKVTLEYWDTLDIAHDTCSERLVALFGELFFPELADRWVLYAPNLLAGMSKKSIRYDQPLFPSALCGEYTEASIDATWEAKTQSMAPLFSVEADTFRSQREPLQDSSFPYTAASQYDRPGSLIQSQLLISRSVSQSQVELRSSSTQGANDFSALQDRPGSRRFVKKSIPTTRADTTTSSPQYSKKGSKKFFQDRYAIQKKQEEAQLNREKNERQGKVSITRKYRIGEFPDIQIAQRDIMEPLMELCATHTHTSTLAFEALFSSIVTSPSFERYAELAEKIERSLNVSTSSSVYVGCIETAYLSSLIKNAKICETLSISSKTLGEAGLASGQFYLSELIINEQVICNSERNRRDLVSHDELAACWDLLYKLLSTVHKQNFLIALSMACSTTNESKLALQAQLSGDLPLAIASYKKAESVLLSQMENVESSNTLAMETDATRCCWQRLGCLETLNNWETLQQELTETVGEDCSSLWEQTPPYLQQGIGHYLRSHLGIAGTDRSNGLRAFVEGATKESKKEDLIESRFPVEVVLMYISSGNTNQARVSVEKFYTSFFSEWSHTSVMATTTRLLMMQSLSSMVELDEILMLASKNDQRLMEQNDQVQADFKTFMNKWGELSPSTGEGGMSIWSQFYMVQDLVIGSLLSRDGQELGTLSDEARLCALETKSKVMLKYANAAISCNILALGSKMLKGYRELCKANSLPKVSVSMVEVFVSHVLKLVERQSQQSSSSGQSSSSIKLITRYYETATKMFDNVEVMNMMESAIASDRVAMGYLEAKTFASAAGFYALNDLDAGLKEEYFSRSLDVFQEACKRIDSSNNTPAGNLATSSSSAFLRCRLTFIEFLVDLLFKREMEKLAQNIDRKILTNLLVDNVLRGMASGDRECANYFPQLCDMIAPYPDIVHNFEQHIVSNVPLWTCLPWSSQLMALLNGPIGKTIVVILEKMAETYPVALFYDFKVTCGLSLDTFKVDLHRLEVLLSNPVMEKFVSALRLIHHPEIRLKEGLREIAKLLESNRTSDARQKVNILWEDCFSPDRPLLGGQIGRYNRDWSRQAKRDIERIMGKEGAKMTTKTVAAAREWIVNHFSVTPGKYGITKDMKVHLGDFSEWLEEFDHSNCVLELPGQYTSYWGKPEPSTHTRILSFDSMLGVLASKQLPKRLTVHCSDEKDYTFLVKGGEDLRLDQRIEQLFGVMNEILDVDSRCRDQGLSIRTYSVIPMTQEIGILEWVPDTSTLKGVIESQLQIDERCTDLKSNKRQKLELFNTTAAKAYESFLLKQRGSSFGAKVIAPRSSDVVAQYAKVQAMIPGDLLRRQLLGMGSHFESFIMIRDHFLKSLAAFSACSYVLGIGDRHLDNFLLDLSSGRVIGIDFGVSFGAGASVLPVPELIPFRYTRQMDFVFRPYDGANLMAQDMQSVFEALRSKRQVIESVMNVFLHEPLLDWQQSTTTHQKGLFNGAEGDDRSTLQDSDVDMETQEEQTSRSRKKLSAPTPAGGTAATAWLPDVKITIARRKLEGVSPGLLLKEELAQNPHLKQHMSKFYSLIDGVCGRDDGAQEIAAVSSLEQANELLAMSTSPDLLGRTFQGWMPWL